MTLYHYISIFGKERLFFPNLVVYAKYIYSVDGFKECIPYYIYTYIGLGPNIKGICTEHFPSSFITNV